MTNPQALQKLKGEALELLRTLREDEGNCYYGLEYLVEKLGCKAEELYDWDTDSGILYELEREGKIGVAHGTSPAFIAYGEMNWDSW